VAQERLRLRDGLEIEVADDRDHHDLALRPATAEAEATAGRVLNHEFS
jgi:hypothetical protein